jgi:hypothetical protein
MMLLKPIVMRSQYNTNTLPRNITKLRRTRNPLSLNKMILIFVDSLESQKFSSVNHPKSPENSLKAQENRPHQNTYSFKSQRKQYL